MVVKMAKKEEKKENILKENILCETIANELIMDPYPELGN